MILNNHSILLLNLTVLLLSSEQYKSIYYFYPLTLVGVKIIDVGLYCESSKKNDDDEDEWNQL